MLAVSGRQRSDCMSRGLLSSRKNATRRAFHWPEDELMQIHSYAW
jgi:hypothetical protein